MLTLPKLEYLFDKKVSFPALEELEVYDMKGLRKIWQIPQPVGSFHRLRYLTVWGCHNLLNIVPSNIFLQLQHLESLWVFNCNNLEEIVGDPIGELEHANVAMRALKVIRLKYNPVLKSFCRYNKIDFELPCLRRVELIGCPKMGTFTYGNLTTPMLQVLSLSTKWSIPQRTMWNGDLNSTVRVLYSENNNHHHNTGGKRNYNNGIIIDENNNDRDGGANDDCNDGSNYDYDSNNADGEGRNDHHHDEKRRRIS